MTGLGPSPQILRKQTPKVLADAGVKTDGLDRCGLSLYHSATTTRLF